jgi:polyhydroxyalkanoate synthesis regulator phasin
MSDKLSFDEKMKLVEQGKIDKKTGKFTSMDAMREAKGFKPGETPAQFNTRRSVLEGAKKTLKATKYGKIAAGIAGAGLALKQYLKSKTNKVEDVDKKSMGGEIEITKGKDYIKDLL